MFTQQHFIALAKTIAAMPAAHKHEAAVAIAAMSAKHNPKFNRDKFLKACNVVGELPASQFSAGHHNNEADPITVSVRQDGQAVFVSFGADEQIAMHIEVDATGFPVVYAFADPTTDEFSHKIEFKPVGATA